jgi:hypothetical protein
VDLEVVRVHHLIDLDEAVSLVETHPLANCSGRSNEARIECRLHELAIVPIRGSDKDGQRDPAPIGEKGSLDSQLSTIGGVRSGPLSSEGSLRHRAVHRLPRPAQTSLGIVLEESLGPETLEDPGASPLLEARMNRARRTEVSREGTPLAASAGEVEDPLHAAAVVDARTTAARTSAMNGNKPGDPKPERIGERERRRDRGE